MAKSAKKIILTAFNVCDLQSLTMKKHLVPLSKVVNVKYRSNGKYQLLLPLAKKLVEAGHIKINVDDDKVNYRNLKRNDLEVSSDLKLLIVNAQCATSDDAKGDLPKSNHGYSQSPRIVSTSSGDEGNGMQCSQLPSVVNSDDDETQQDNGLTFTQIFS